MARTHVAAITAAASFSIAFAAAWTSYKRRLRRHGVVTSFIGYMRARYHLRKQPSSLMLIVDFDRTMSTAACGTSCHGVVESCSGLSADYKAKTKALFEHYYPIEIDPTTAVEHKIPLMVRCTSLTRSPMQATLNVSC